MLLYVFLNRFKQLKEEDNRKKATRALPSDTVTVVATTSETDNETEDELDDEQVLFRVS